MASTPDGTLVGDTDPSHYVGVRPRVHLEKLTNREDADEPPGPRIPVGEPVVWHYVVGNPGEVTLTEVKVTDDPLGEIECPMTELAPGERMVCSAEGVAVDGQYRNVGKATAVTPEGVEVRHADPSHYHGVPPDEARIDLEKLTNGQDADGPPSPRIPVGAPVEWTYVVTNRGGVSLGRVVVMDTKLGRIPCPAIELAPGGQMTCKARGVAGHGLYINVGVATAVSPTGERVWDVDPSHYVGVLVGQPRVDIEKATNGRDADTPPGPVIPVGDPVKWSYVVTNRGDTVLQNVQVSDNPLGDIVCPKDALRPGESMTCLAQGVAVVGQYRNMGMVVAVSPDGMAVRDADPSHYFGRPVGVEGCSVEFWRTHPVSWRETGLTPDQTVESVFADAALYPDTAAMTLMQALGPHVGAAPQRAARALFRQGVAAALNAAHPGVDYPMTYDKVAELVNAALASGDATKMEVLTKALAVANSLRCPLSWRLQPGQARQ